MRLAVELAIMDMDGDISAVAVGKDADKFHGMLQLNESAAEIIKLLTEDTTPEKILAEMQKKYQDTPVDEIGHSIADILNQLNRAGLLID